MTKGTAIITGASADIQSNILYLTSSPRGSESYSNRIADDIIRHLRRANPRAALRVRDLAQDPLPHIDADFIAATRRADGPATERQRAILTRSDALVDELLAADVVVIAAPMINFSVPTTLKSWFDYIARAGRTFSYSEAGPKGLVTGKRVIVVSASGGIYSGGQSAALDFQVPWLTAMLAFLGMTDVDIVRIEGTALGPEAARKALELAAESAHDLVPVAAAA
jgi:FMN-dependent NADH-azoreductase